MRPSSSLLLLLIGHNDDVGSLGDLGDSGNVGDLGNVVDLGVPMVQRPVCVAPILAGPGPSGP
eukprot:7940461-Pyramimonas_sp.AAC.1